MMNPPELEKPRVTEILVRMDCNGCVQKIKKALHGINGIYDMYIDFPQQKLTIIGWADPEKIVKAIRKCRKTATICSHSEQAQPNDAPAEGGQPPAESANPPPPEAPPAETSQPGEPPKDPPPPENPPQEVLPPPPATEGAPPASQSGQPSGPKEVEEVHVIYHHPPDYGYRYNYGPNIQGYGGQGSSVINAPGIQPAAGPGIRQQTPSPIYVAHSYNTYKPSPYVTEYVSPPQYSQEPSRPEPPQNPHHVHYSEPEQPKVYSRPEPPQVYSRPEPPQVINYSRQEPPQHMNYSRPEPPQNMNYSRQEAPQVVNYSRQEPPHYMHYSRQEPPQYSYYSTPEPQQYTYYSRLDQYSEDYRNDGYGNRNGNITSVFSDENPNACRIV